MTAPDVVIRVVNVSKRFVIRKEKSLKERIVNFGRSQKHKEDFMALDGVSFEIVSGTTVGLIGPNGSGKSTLLKAIGGIIQPTTGTVERKGRLAALLELGAGFHPDLTGRENVYLNAAILGLSRKQIDEYFDDIVEFSGIGRFIDTQVKFYSSGMYVRLAFAVSVHVDPEVLLVDEVLAVGDEPFQRKCIDRIRAFQREGKTIVIVTHSLDVIGSLCSRAIVLETGKVVFDGEPGMALRVLRDGFEQARQEEQVRHEEHAHLQARGIEALELATIDSVELWNAETGEPVGLLDSGDALRVDIKLRSKRPLEDCVIGIGVETPLGQTVFGTNTERLDLLKISFTGGVHLVSFTLPGLTLLGGMYFLHASFGTIEEGELFRLPQAASFEVVEASRNEGILSVRATAVVVA